jgi:hypothetical protein
MQHKIQAVVVDYLQLMTAGTDNRGSREQEVSTISRSLKAIAKELDIPIMALSQLNRSVESREGKRPQLSDLRESGAIEQDADIVLFIHRPEYYGITDDENGNSLRGVAEIIIAKHRNGATEEVHLSFRKELAKFSDLETHISNSCWFTGTYICIENERRFRICRSRKYAAKRIVRFSYYNRKGEAPILTIFRKSERFIFSGQTIYLERLTIFVSKSPENLKMNCLSENMMMKRILLQLYWFLLFTGCRAHTC